MVARTSLPRYRVAVGIAGALLAGATLAAQTRINGALAHALTDSLIAALVSFLGGAAVAIALVFISPSARAAARRIIVLLRAGRLRWWQLLGGVAGALFVVAQTVTGAIIGAAVFTVALVAGQIVSGLVVDRLGVGAAGALPVTKQRVVAAGLGIVAATLAVYGAGIASDAWWLWLLPVGAGAGLAWQQAVNGRVAAASGDPMPATLINFVAGTALIGCVAAVRSWDAETSVRWEHAEPWMYSGGFLGVGVVLVSVLVVAWTGVLVFGLALTAGQLLCSLLLDSVFPVSAGLPWGLLVGGGLVLCAVTVASWSVDGRRRD